MRVVVTGIGMVTPLGSDRETSWRRIAAGERAGRWLDENCRTSSEPCGGGWAGAPALADSTTSREPVVELALRAAREAVADARLDLAALDRERVGCVIGTSKGGLRSFAEAYRQARGGRPASHASPTDSTTTSAFPEWAPHTASAAVAAEFGLRGAALCPVAACATGLAAILRGADLIHEGVCDIVLAGSGDASLTLAVLASFRRMGVLARDFADPAAACRPFDRRRDGFLVGEGAAVLVLEGVTSAAVVTSDELRVTSERTGTRPARGSPLSPYAELLAGGCLADVSGLTALDPDARALTRLIGDVLRRGGLAPGDLDYVNLHGTATIANDRCETRALRRSLGTAADGVPCSSFKGAIGHLLGAAGSVETACTLLAMRDGIIPPTANLDEPGAGCDLDYVPRAARRGEIRHALKLSLGFGGHLTAAAFRRGGRRMED
ncbi:MAG: beta-ketoacyl-[acyl-carrier-protein] synthase family protein [Planctomycetaceae bacterium]